MVLIAGLLVNSVGGCSLCFIGFCEVLLIGCWCFGVDLPLC